MVVILTKKFKLSIMKKIKSHRIAMAFMAIVAFSCSDDFLNTSPRDKIGEDLVWSSEANTRAFIYSTYDEVLGNMYSNYLDQEALTPNSVSFFIGPPTPARNTTYTSEYNAGFNRYRTIRNCNLIIENVASSSLGDGVKKELIAHGKFLRAMTYYWLAKRFGKVVWIDRVLTQDEPTYEFPRTTDIATTYQNIMNDIDAAIEGLPAEGPTGIANKFAAYALKSEVALTAGAYTGDSDYYQIAVEAADEVLASPHVLSSSAQYEGLFNEKESTNNEIILARYRAKANTICLDTDMMTMVPNQKNDVLLAAGASPQFKSPFVIFEAWLDWAPSQNLVDDYLVNEGGVAKKWNETNAYADNITPVANGGNHNDGGTINSILYGNRDKRFYATIVYDEAAWFGETVTTKIKGNLHRKTTTNGGNTRHLSITNYYWKKGVYNVTPRVYWDQQTDYHWVIFRTGRVILNKAEALLRQNKIGDAVIELNKTRVTHGGLPASTAASSADAWIDYKRERHVELALENDYYFSLLRWGMYGGDANGGKAPQADIDELKAVPNAIEINQAGTGYTIVPITEGSNNIRGFTAPRNFLFPVPESEKRVNTKLDQNPGW